MFSKAEKSFVLNVLLMVIWLGCMITGLAMFFIPREIRMLIPSVQGFHIMCGITACVLTMIHLALHIPWFRYVTKNLFSTGKKTVTVCVLMAASLGVCAVLYSLAPVNQHPQPHGSEPAPQVDQAQQRHDQEPGLQSDSGKHRRAAQ